MKTKVRLCKLLFSTRLLVSLLIILGILECLHWLQGGAGEGFPGSNDLILGEEYPELSSMKSSSNFPSSAHLPEAAATSLHLIQVKSNPKKKENQNILLLAYARSGNNFEIRNIFKNSALKCSTINLQAPHSLVNFCQLEPGQLTIMSLSSGGYTVQPNNKTDKDFNPDIMERVLLEDNLAISLFCDGNKY